MSPGAFPEVGEWDGLTSGVALSHPEQSTNFRWRGACDCSPQGSKLKCAVFMASWLSEHEVVDLVCTGKHVSLFVVPFG